MTDDTNVEDRHREAAALAYPKRVCADGCPNCRDTIAARAAHARACADWEAQVLAEVADWLDREAEVSAGQERAAYRAVAPALRSGAWRGETTEGTTETCRYCGGPFPGPCGGCPHEERGWQPK